MVNKTKVCLVCVLCSLLMTACSSPKQVVQEYNTAVSSLRNEYIVTDKAMQDNLETIVDFLVYYKLTPEVLNLISEQAYLGKEEMDLEGLNDTDKVCKLWNIANDMYDGYVADVQQQYMGRKDRSAFYDDVHTEGLSYDFSRCNLLSSDLYMTADGGMCYVCELQGKKYNMLLKIYLFEQKVSVVERILQERVM